MKRGMVNDNATLNHHFFQVALAKRVSQIPANALSDNINGIMESFKGILD
jgi:hypothetical protein